MILAYSVAHFTTVLEGKPVSLRTVPAYASFRSQHTCELCFKFLCYSALLTLYLDN
jgi:hypothetical protein